MKPILDQIPRCNRCTHYYITHDQAFKYGCRALDFKSKQQPIRDVVEASGLPCLYFEVKKRNGLGR
jgi:hypothetical protein